MQHNVLLVMYIDLNIFRHDINIYIYTKEHNHFLDQDIKHFHHLSKFPHECPFPVNNLPSTK